MRFFGLSLILIFIVTHPASAQIKKWVDEEGVIHIEAEGELGQRRPTFKPPRAETPKSLSGLARVCAISAINVRGFNVKIERPRVKFTGEIVNGCAKPMGVQIQVVARDEAGRVIDVMEAWPASIRNIPAGGSYPFSIRGLMNYDDRMKRFAIRVIEIRQW